MSARYRKKPVEVDAMLYFDNGKNHNGPGVAEWCGGRHVYRPDPGRYVIEIDTLEGTMTAEAGDWIICGVKGEFYPCKPDIFRETYDRVEGVPSASDVTPNASSAEAKPLEERSDPSADSAELAATGRTGAGASGHEAVNPPPSASRSDATADKDAEFAWSEAHRMEERADQLERELEGRKRFTTRMSAKLTIMTRLYHRSTVAYGRLLERNAQLCKMLPNAPAHLVGEPPEDANAEFDVPDDTDMTLADFEEAKRTGIPVKVYASREEYEAAVDVERDGDAQDGPYQSEAVRVALLAMEQAAGTLRWAEANVPGTNMQSDLLLLDRGIELLSAPTEAPAEPDADAPVSQPDAASPEGMTK